MPPRLLFASALWAELNPAAPREPPPMDSCPGGPCPHPHPSVLHRLRLLTGLLEDAWAPRSRDPHLEESALHVQICDRDPGEPACSPDQIPGLPSSW